MRRREGKLGGGGELRWQSSQTFTNILAKEKKEDKRTETADGKKLPERGERIRGRT